MTLDQLDREFVERIKLVLPEGVSLDRVHVFDNQLVVYLNQDNKTCTPIGCPVCFQSKIEQDSAGYPQVKGKSLLSAADLGLLPKSVSPEIAANVWLCPNCKVAATSLIPRFDV